MKIKFTQLLIFGATGDLASLKLFPAVFELFEQKLLPANFQLIGFGRSELEQEKFKQLFKKAVLEKQPNVQEKLDKLIERVFYFSGQYDNAESFEAFSDYCQDLAKNADVERIAYFSVPPSIFELLVKNLADSFKKVSSCLKIVIEKPFGIDEKSAEHLFRIISENFEEKNVYLLDHFLGKKPIQSILKLRLDNNVINLMIKPSEIANIQITAIEELDVGKRVGYYDQVGCMKDMVQSHLLQILALITMDMPLLPTIESLQREKHNILSAVRFSGLAEDVVFGQFNSYQKLEGVQKNSQTDTFVALKLNIDRRDWFNTPIYIRSGKMLNENLTRVVIEFKKMPFQSKLERSNKLVFEMKPNESVGLKLIQEKLTSKGNIQEDLELEQTLSCSTDFCLNDYASLIFDIMGGHKNFFLSYPEIVASWKVIDGVVKIKENGKAKLHKYVDQGNGPKEFLGLTEKQGFKWN